MKKLKLITMVIALFAAAGAGAQMKVAYISIDNMVAVMPETAKIDSILERYVTDSLQPRYNYTLAEYLRKDSIVNGKDSAKTPAAVRQKIREEMQNDAYELQNWQSIVQQLTQNKENQLLAPIYREVFAAIQQVAKEKGYTHVLNKESLLVAPDGDDIIALVAQKLKVTLPPQLKPGISASSSPAGN
jgi:outer membrane protein